MSFFILNELGLKYCVCVCVCACACACACARACACVYNIIYISLGTAVLNVTFCSGICPSQPAVTRSLRRLNRACNRFPTGMLSRKRSNPLFGCYEPMAELPSLPIYREISRKYTKINPISRSPAFDLQSPAKESFCLFLRVFLEFIWPARRFASFDSSTVHGKCREQPSGDYTRRI